MTPTRPTPSSRHSDALISAALLAVSAERLGGAVLGGMLGEAHEAWLEAFAGLRSELGPPLRLPPAMGAAQLAGGIDLAASLATGTRVMQPSIGERSGGRPLLLTGAERWSDADCAQLMTAVGPEQEAGARRLILAMDESLDDDPGIPSALSDRLAFKIDLDGVRASSLAVPEDWSAQASDARARFDLVAVPDSLIQTIVATAVALGIGSSRADSMAVTAARAHAAWRGARTVAEEDVEAAVRLVLAPRARQLPAEASEPQEPEETSQDSEPDDRETPESGPDQEPDEDSQAPEGIEDRMIEAAAAALPPGLLDLLRGAPAGTSASRGQGRKLRGRQRKARSGRPVGHLAGDPRRDGPLHLLATIEKAAPWQVVRRLQMARGSIADAHQGRRLFVLPSDIRVMRFKRHAPTLTIFAVDASGSAAMNRLGEAKGAVELLLAECYVRREQVALVAFRGTGAEILLPPTRALARARRTLAQLAGGGGTPLANGIDTAHDLAMTARRAGQACLVVLLTDGRANIDSSGIPDRKRATEHAIAAARRLAADSIASLLVDVASVPSTRASDIARNMNARYLPLPNAGAQEIASVVALGRKSAA